MKRVLPPYGIWILVIVSMATASREAKAEEEHDAKSYVEPEISERDRRFWAFRAPERPAVPQGERKEGTHPLDAFVEHTLRSVGIPGLSASAAPETILRRLAFQTTGLPPTPGEVRRFQTAWQKNPDAALDAAVSDWLARPAYGEHWAQHWLDVARFAETDGFEHDKVRSEAWRYRDWVIDALNQDLRYDRFVALQIAGDELEPENPEAWVATGFLLGGPDMPDINLEAERRHNVLNEMTGAIGAVFLGLTLECAQCHDHKSDPISQADFYRMRAVFEAFDLPKKNESLPVVFPVDGSREVEGNLYLRGDFRRPGPALAPGVPRIFLASEESEQVFGGHPRAEFARWLVREEQPLVARVIVNRVWAHYFGEPLVGSPSDFGKLGERPSHPDLLDWLAIEFMEQGWSLKWLHREILLSHTWRQASRLAPGANAEEEQDWRHRLEIDPDNRWLSRQRRQRLSGEMIRDSLLFLAGRLNSKPGGPGVRPPLPPEVTVTLLSKQWPVTRNPEEHDRRSIYLFARRNLRFPFFAAFDRPDPNQSCGRRYVSTTAPQALTLLNDDFVWRMSEATSQRAAASGPLETASERVDDAFRRVLGRLPDEEERRLGVRFLEQHPMEQFYLGLFNLSEFLYLD